jgi:predicted Rossmann fold flavoprotein
MADSPEVAVIGAGAAGLAAAIGAARRGAAVTVLERLPGVGKKLLATGGGRCNLLNDCLAASAFTSTDPGLVSSVLGRRGGREIRAFFEGLGLRLLPADEAGRVYPATNQAASVLKVLELETARLHVAFKTGFDAERIEPAGRGFRIAAADGRRIEARVVVLTGGGRSYPALGSNGSAHDLAASFGHRIVKPVPSAVPVLVRSRWCHVLQGLRLRARVESRVGERPRQRAEGELLFTQYGLSGPAILDVSESLSIALNREERRDASVIVDVLPFMTEKEAAAELDRRAGSGWAPRDLACGLLPEKFCVLLPEIMAEAAGVRGRGREAGAAQGLAARLKALEFPVLGTRGWNEAEFTAGGVDAREVEPGSLASKRRSGLYFAGEVLDVQGGRGGFNLAWAWASGLVAGLEAAGPR